MTDGAAKLSRWQLPLFVCCITSLLSVGHTDVAYYSRNDAICQRLQLAMRLAQLGSPRRLGFTGPGPAHLVFLARGGVPLPLLAFAAWGSVASSVQKTRYQVASQIWYGEDDL